MSGRRHRVAVTSVPENEGGWRWLPWSREDDRRLDAAARRWCPEVDAAAERTIRVAEARRQLREEARS